MKKIVFMMLFGAMGLTLGAQTQKQKVSVSEVRPVADTKAEKYAQIKFDTLRHNFGKFPASNPIVKCTFPFTNVGTAPLVIHQAFASCGCTVPRFTKEPVKPGEKGEIEITYDGTDRFPGHFTKSVTIRSNSVNEVVRLTIEGTME